MKYDKSKYKVYTWKNWMMLHWILNPVLAINELILGQRVPKILLEDKTIVKPRIERSFVPCPHCNTLHDGRTWSTENGTAFKNWFGLYCNKCGKIIPCLTNGLSFIILAITFPIWGWFRKSLKAKWLAKQPQRFDNIKVDYLPKTMSKKSWIIVGLVWGAFMFLVMSIGFPYIEGEEITKGSLISGIILWTIGGLLFGYFMYLYTNKSIKKAGKSLKPVMISHYPKHPQLSQG